ncbi:MAG: chemotaxis protein CheR [Alteromonadaceae bacterium]|nr:MAG: chemotaxis protein CheR [Alteromonadaceae bacterium]
MRDLHQQKLSMEDFNRLARLVCQTAGINFTVAKHAMVEGRVRKRLKATSIETYKEYLDYVVSAQGGDEAIRLIDCLTTNKTNFFRESQHFDYMIDHLLPRLAEEGVGRHRPLRIWSAGCSSGEEPYTLAMILEEWNQHHAVMDFEIHATDISLSALKKASLAIYTEQDVKPISLALRRKYLLRSLADENVIKIAPRVKKHVSFARLNFQDADYVLPSSFDIIFCRNVLIYFNKDVVERVINRLCVALVAQGSLFLGHSESIHGLNVPLDTVSPTTYQKRLGRTKLRVEAQ